MTIYLSDIVDLDELNLALLSDMVNRQLHPDDLDLAILNYSHKCQVERNWNDVTRACRGLIYRVSTGEVLARPFAKFHNYGEPGAPELAADEPAIVTEKLDGSLGIIYIAPDGRPAVATRGSFASEQAIWATKKLREWFPAWWPTDGWTYLVEIIYPGNRIVIDYGDREDLALLGAVNISSGRSTSAAGITNRWPGGMAMHYPYRTLAEALAAPPRTGADGAVIAEGYVVHFPRTDERVKIKQDDYVALHKIVTNLNARVVWEHLRDGGTVEQINEALAPDLQAWVTAVAVTLYDQMGQMAAAAAEAYERAVAELPEGYTRKELAEQVMKHDLWWLMFMIADGKSTKRALWKAVRPSGTIRPGRLAEVGE